MLFRSWSLNQRKEHFLKIRIQYILYIFIVVKVICEILFFKIPWKIYDNLYQYCFITMALIFNVFVSYNIYMILFSGIQSLNKVLYALEKICDTLILKSRKSQDLENLVREFKK